jgi:5-methylthioadenosine/S-adenosylhomocysteine deaminase
VTGDNGNTIPNGVVASRDGIISYVGPKDELPLNYRSCEIIGGQHSLVMPSFKNGHFHSECWTGEGTSERIFEYTNILLGVGRGPISSRARYLLALYGLIQCMKGGQTAVIDCFYGDPVDYLESARTHLQAYRDVGLRVDFALSLRDQNLIGHIPDDVLLAKLSAPQRAALEATDVGYPRSFDTITAVFADLRSEWCDNPRITIALAPDWTPACSDVLLRECRLFADRVGCGLTTHVLETRSERYWNQIVNGEGALRRLENLGYLSDDVTLGHFVWASDGDIAVLARSRAVASYDPGSNLRLSSGVARAQDILEAGGRLCIGTDGISFADNEDFFAELRLGGLLQRQPKVFLKNRLSSAALLHSACVVGAEAVHHPEVGALVPGKQADLLLVNADRVFGPAPRFRQSDVLNTLVDRASASDISQVVMGGQPVIIDGTSVRFNEEAILEELASLATEELYPRVSAEVEGAVAALIESLASMYQGWYDRPVLRPASIFNER